MVDFNRFEAFSEDMGDGVHNLGSDTLKIILSNTAPDAEDAILTDITQITAEHGYSAGGSAVTGTAFSQTDGVAKLTGTDVVFTATGGTIGPFQYAILYNSTATDGPLIGWLDNGTAITLSDTHIFTVHWDETDGILTLQ